MMRSNWIKRLQFVGISLILLSISSTACAVIDQKAVKNLSGFDYLNKRAITETIKQLYANADQQDAYSLSLPLIASAQQGDVQTYNQVLQSINNPLNSMDNDTFKAWLLGRVLLAADSIGDETTAANVIPQLRAIIVNFNGQNYADASYAYYAWACAYLAAYNQDEYLTTKKMMVDAANKLTAVSLQTGTHDALSNAMWAWVMAAQAATNAHDKNTYDLIINRIKTVSGQSSVKGALTTSLLRTDSSSDYPAWAIGIVALSAATIHDNELYADLQPTLTQTIQQAKAWGEQSGQSPANQWKANAEASLGRLNQVLARIRYQ